MSSNSPRDMASIVPQGLHGPTGCARVSTERRGCACHPSARWRRRQCAAAVTGPTTTIEIEEGSFMGLRRLFSVAVAAAALALMTGCATKAPPYQPSIDNVNTLKKTGASVASVGTFGTQPGAPGATSIQ